MAPGPQTASGAPSLAINPRWLFIARLASWISILCIALLYGILALQSWRETGEIPWRLYLVLLIPTLAPYPLILFRLRDETLGKGVALAAVTAWAGLIGAVFGGLTISGDQGFALALFLPQILLLTGAYGAHRALRQQTGEQPKLTRVTPQWSVGLLPICCFFILTILPQGTASKLAANQASALGWVRTINAAEIAYADTYKGGFSPSLAALCPPPAGALPSASAADLIPADVTSGVHRGYGFTYTPGLPDSAGHIQTYTLTARPLQYRRTGRSSFFTDQSGVVRRTAANRPATARDPSLE